MIKITKLPRLCKCGHQENQHSNFGDRKCLVVRHLKTRVKNQITDKYVRIDTHLKCCCDKFEEYKE